MSTADLPFSTPDPLLLVAALDVQLDLAKFLLAEMHAVLERLPEEAADHLRQALAEVSRASIELRAARADVVEAAS